MIVMFAKSVNSVKDKIFLTKYSLWDRNANSFYRKLIKNQYLSLDELSSINWEKRKKIVQYAFDNVPFYHRFYQDSGFHPLDLKRPEDYFKIPLLKKEHLRMYMNELISKGVSPRHLKCSTTGGSTGMPVKVFLDKRVSHAPMGWRMLNWWGASPSMDTAILWRRIDSPGRQLFDKLLWWPTRHLMLNASYMTHENLFAFVKKFNRIRPAILHGYVGAIHHLANFIYQTGLSINPPLAVQVTCSPLSKVHRLQMERIFQAPVYDTYGSCEVYWISAECSRKHGLHIFHDIRHVEFTNPSGEPVSEGAIGNILITDLENRAFPIIRYDIGDMGRALTQKCPCGVNLPLMDSIMGKSVDLIKLPDGSCLSDMNVIFDDFPEVVNGFQVIQKADYSIQINYIPTSDSGSMYRALDIVKKRLLDQVSSKVEISFKAVDHIPHQKGKLKYIISEINQDSIYPDSKNR